MENKLKHISVPSSEITPQSQYLSRRDWLKMMGIVSATAFLAACAPKLATAVPTGAGSGSGLTDELGTAANTFEEITNYNNYYEFTTDKQGVSSALS